MITRALKRLGAISAVVALGLVAGACGSAGVASKSTTPGGGSAGGAYSAVASGGFLNDGDRDHVGDLDDDNSADNDNDPVWDYKTQPKDNNSYHDSDDSSSVLYHQATSLADRSAITAVVKRYYAAMAMSNGAVACSQMLPVFAKAVPLDYGQFGPAYLHGAKTCPAVLVRMARRNRGQLSAPVVVTDVRVKGDQGVALLGSAKIPASSIGVQRERGAWKIAMLLGTPLP